MISAMLCRRPLTIEDIIRITGMPGGEVAKILRDLEESGEISSVRGDRGVFYSNCQLFRSDPKER